MTKLVGKIESVGNWELKNPFEWINEPRGWDE